MKNSPFVETVPARTELECVLCHAKADPQFVFTGETGNHFCFTCWLNQGTPKVPRQRLTLIER